MANQPIRALIEAVFILQQIDDDPMEVQYDYSQGIGPPFQPNFAGAVRFYVGLSCLLHDMKRFAMFVHGLSLMLQSNIYDGLIDNEYDDEMRAVIHAYNECCQAHDTGVLHLCLD